ncbi:VIM family subclass B1 metallo-beta-lactamase [Alcanivorax sp. N3-2A]|nr:VIM family subclass B1 metallo-beta-lactamase [Alcanivorax sp. N3-2A]|tara:strand:- start:104429 stop:105190 length:762 start_codon:yes stop_codon:yes gene_type:complete
MIRNPFLPFLLLLGLVFAGCQSHPAGHAPAGDPGLRVEPLAPGVWMHTSYNTFDGVLYPSNGLIVREGDHLVLLDSAWGAPATGELLAWIDEHIGLPVQRALSTHFHDDRTGGADVLKAAGVTVWAHPMTRRLSAREGNPVPEKALPGLETVGSAVGWGSLEILYPGGGHAPDNLMVWLPAQRILYGGCAVREMATDNLGNTGDADLQSWPRAIALAQQRYPGVERVIPGHGEPGGPELLTHMHELFKANGVE